MKSCVVKYLTLISYRMNTVPSAHNQYLQKQYGKFYNVRIVTIKTILSTYIAIHPFEFIMNRSFL